jgi:hypothetical protein
MQESWLAPGKNTSDGILFQVLDYSMELTRLHLMGAAGILLAFTAVGVPSRDGGNPYANIPERNIFGLKEAPPVPITTNEPAPALPKLYLTGITTILGNKRAFLTVQYPTKPGQAAKEEPLTLSEGQRDGAIEVLTVDEVRKRVRVNNSGTEMTLDFENNGAKASPVGVNGAAPGAPGAGMPVAGGQPPQRVASSTPTVPPPPFQSQPGTLRRSLRLPNTPTTTVSPPTSNAALFGPAAVAQRQANGTAAQLTPEEEQILRALGDTGAQVAPQ